MFWKLRDFVVCITVTLLIFAMFKNMFVVMEEKSSWRMVKIFLYREIKNRSF